VSPFDHLFGSLLLATFLFNSAKFSALLLPRAESYSPDHSCRRLYGLNVNPFVRSPTPTPAILAQHLFPERGEPEIERSSAGYAAARSVVSVSVLPHGAQEERVVIELHALVSPRDSPCTCDSQHDFSTDSIFEIFAVVIRSMDAKPIINCKHQNDKVIARKN